MNDRFNIQNQVEQLQMKYVGTGHADLSKWYVLKEGNYNQNCIIFYFLREWGTNIQRDSLASHLGHHSRLTYFAAAENESFQRIKSRLITVKILNLVFQS